MYASEVSSSGALEEAEISPRGLPVLQKLKLLVGHRVPDVAYLLRESTAMAPVDGAAICTTTASCETLKSERKGSPLLHQMTTQV
jgi:hypothetical protein